MLGHQCYPLHLTYRTSLYASVHATFFPKNNDLIEKFIELNEILWLIQTVEPEHIQYNHFLSFKINIGRLNHLWGEYAIIW